MYSERLDVDVYKLRRKENALFNVFRLLRKNQNKTKLTILK